MSEEIHLSNRRILVVDDNQAIHDDFRKILGPRAEAEADAELLKTEAALFGDTLTLAVRHQLRLDFAFQGEEALGRVKQAFDDNDRYAMAFMDVRMPPGWDGIETTARLWQLDPDIQVVICTAYSDKSWEDVKEKLGHPESVLILKKPFDTIEVLQLAHALTEKWALLQASRQNLENLEHTVDLRTRELQVAHQHLTASERRYRTLNASAPGATMYDASSPAPASS